MKRIFAVVIAAAFAFSVAGFAAAAERKAAPATAPATEKAAPADKSAPMGEKKMEKKESKPKAHQITGTIEGINAAAGTLSVKGKKGNVDLKAGEKVKLGDFKVGDKVVVKHVDATATSVKVVKAPKAKKAEPKAEAKPMTTEKK